MSPSAIAEVSKAAATGDVTKTKADSTHVHADEDVVGLKALSHGGVPIPGTDKSPRIKE